MGKLKPWKTLGIKDVSPSKWFPLEQHKVQLPSGKIVDDYFVSPLYDVAMILPVTPAGEIIFVRQYKHGAGEIILELPAGFVDPGLTVTQCAVKELEEETGIKITEDDLLPLGRVRINPSKFKQIVYGFLVKDVCFNSLQKIDEQEEIEVVKIPAAEALAMIKSGEIIAVDTVAFILKAAQLHPEVFA